MPEQESMIPEEKPIDLLVKSLEKDWSVKTQLQQAFAVLNYLNQLTGQKFQTINPAGKHTANAKLVIDRIREGYEKEDFKKVLRSKSREWLGDEKMEKNLRPSTLFRKSNFETYVAQSDDTGRPAIAKGSAPDPLDTLTDFLRSWQDREKSWGYEMPPVPGVAAKWWIEKMQEKCSDMEVLRQVTKKNAKKSGDTVWSFPYIDRLMYTLRKYLMLSREDQVVIYGCVDDGIHWRGDDIDFFYNNEHSIYNETMKMRELGMDEYKKQSGHLYQMVESSIVGEL
jgi:uncharacterized phage protein (TIGR02220 family)